MAEVRGPVGVLGAMEPEIRGLVAAMTVERSGAGPGFDYWAGRLAGRECVVARCGMGKVSAAAGVQRLIDSFGVTCILLCGLAGSLQPDLRMGDVVVGERFVQYDVDASPIFPRFVVPGVGIDFFEAPPRLVAAAEAAARSVLEDGGLGEGVSAAALASFGIAAPSVHRGLIVTGDQFIKDAKRDEILRDFPAALCVEMEGGAIAQVCHLNSVPYVIVRVISDNADEAAAYDFTRFVEQVAPSYAVGIVRDLLGRV